MKVKDVTLQQVVDFKSKLESEFNSLNSARTVFRYFKVLMNHSVRYFGLKVDPTLAVEPIQRVRPNINFIKREDFEKRVKGYRLSLLQRADRLLFYTGLRIGEAFALTWADIDIEKNQLFVDKILDITARIINTPKTAGNVGYVPFLNLFQIC